MAEPVVYDEKNAHGINKSNLKNVGTDFGREYCSAQVLIAVANFKRDRGCARSATQANPVKAKCSRTIERKVKLMMAKATLVTISQEKCTSIRFR